MTNDEYETVIGRLVILKLFLTQHHREDVDAIIEKLETEYLERRSNNKLKE